MDQHKQDLGLREAARKYGIDTQTIRYWIKQGWVLVVRPADGPGKQMRLDEQSLLQALGRYRPHIDRIHGPVTLGLQERAEVKNHQGQGGLGLREAARKYDIDPQTIRYWIKQGSVHVLRESDGPGRTMVLEEATLVKAFENYKPRRNRIGRPLAGVTAAPPPPPPQGSSASVSGWNWPLARRGVVATTVAVALLLMLMIPTVVYGLAATLTPSKDSYLVGEKIDITASITFTHPESVTIDNNGVRFVVGGPQALNVPLPDDKGTFTQADISSYPTYSSDPDSNGPLAAGDPVGTLSGSVTLNNWKFSNFFGYGYGYGYGYTLGSNSSISYDLDYTPPVLLWPAPSALAAPYTAPDKLYNAPGGGGGGGGGNEIQLTEMFSVPGIPGAPYGSEVIDIDFDSTYNEILVLVDGPTKDVVGYLSPQGYVNYNQDATYMPDEAAAIGVVNGQVFIVLTTITMDYGAPQTTWKIKGIGGGPEQAIQDNNGATPTNDIKALMYDTNAGAFFAAEEQPSPNAQITIWKILYDVNTGFGQMSTFQVNAMPTNGGYTGLTPVSATSYLGGYGGQAVQFDPNTNVTLGQHPITGAAGFVVSGITINTSTNKLLLMNKDNNSLYSADIPTAGVSVSTQPVGIAYRVSAGTNSAYILTDCGQSCAYDYITEVKHATGSAGTVKNVSGGFTIPALDNKKGFFAINNAVEGLAYIHPILYIVENVGSGSPNKKRLYKLDVTDATAVAATATGGGWVLVGALSQAVGNVGGMTVKSGKLFLAESTADVVHTVQTDGTYEGSFSLLAAGTFVTPGGLEGIAFISAANNYAGTATFIGVKGNAFYQFKPAAGADQGTITAVNYTDAGSPPFNSKGLSNKQANLLALDGDTGAVYQGSLPGQPDAETTAAGAYTAQLTVASSSPTASTESTATAWDVERVSVITVVITEPLANQGYKAAELTAGKVTIQGTINDPTVTQVAVLADLPSAVLVGYDEGTGLKVASKFTESADQAQYKTNGLWHFTTTADAAIHDPFGPNIQSHNLLSGTYAYFGQNETASAGTSKPNYCQTMPGMPIPAGQTKCMVPDFMQMNSSGFFDTPSVTLSAEGDATLNFDMWWEVETAADWDNLKLQACVGTPGNQGATCETLAQFAATQDLPGNYAAGSTVACASMAFYPACPNAVNLIAVPNANSGGALTSVAFAIPSSLTGAKFFRFDFDSMDPYGNHFSGILLDNISVSGAGSLILAAATVNKSTNPPSWSLLMTPEEGQNKITISAAHTAYVSGGLTGTADATFFLDTAAPTLTMAALVDVTATATLTVSGTFDEAQPKVIEIYKTVGAGTALSTGKFTTFAEGATTFTKQITLSEGSNKIEVRIKDKAGQCNTVDPDDCSTTIADYDTVVLDTTVPVITVGETAYPVGFISARQGDLTVFQTSCTDAAGFGIADVKAALPSSPTTFNQSFRTDIPGAVQDQWLSGITGGSAAAKAFLLPMTVPNSVAPGTLTLNIRCTDTAGNTADSTVSANIVSTLGGFVINLLPGDNIVSLPIIPAIASATTLEASIDTLVAGVLSPVDGNQAIEKILYYDANDTAASQADRWSVWTAAAGDTDSLTTMKPGRGYIFQMRAAAFKASASIAVGVPATQAPIALRYEGTFLLGGQTIPPIYAIEGMDSTNNPAGGTWNLIGLHSEDQELVSNYFQPLESPNRIWGSALVYRNEIIFPLVAGATPEIVLGAFKGLVSTSYIQPGQGLWVFALADGTLVPR